MRSLRQWFRRRAARPAPAAPRALLRVEQLEQRAVPSASSMVDLGGHRIEFDVDSNHNLFRRDDQGTQFLTTGIQFAHAFRDSQGRMGVDLVFTNGLFAQVNADGFHVLATGLLSASTTFDAAGHPVLDVVFSNHSALRISGQGTQFLGNNILSLTNFRDAAGNVGVEIVFTNNVAVEIDSGGARLIGGGFTFLNRFSDDEVELGHRDRGIRNTVLDAVFVNHEHQQFDDNGLRHREREPGDDRDAREPEPGDDRGSPGPEQGDDNGHDHGNDNGDHNGDDNGDDNGHSGHG